MKPAIRRREVLQGGLAATLMPAIARAAIAPRGPETVIVAGAGLAGLAAAYRLRETGRRVIVLEARSEPGGRVRTIRAPFDDGVYGEAGAARISDVHHFVLHWLNNMRLNAVPFSPPEGRTLFVMDTMRGFADDPAAIERLAGNLRQAERGLTPGELANLYLENLPESLARADADADAMRGWAPLDAMAWPQWLAARGASEGAVRLLTLGADSRDISALYVLRQIFLHRAGRGYFKIEGGMDRLPRAMAAELAGDLRYNCEVMGVSHGPQGVRVSYREAGEAKSVDGARVILAIPFSLLRKITIDPPFSPAKRMVVESLPYRSATRFLLQTDRSFWREAGLSGAARTDAPCEIWDASFGQLSVRGLLSVTAGGQPERREQLARLDEAGQLSLGLGMARGAFPEIDNHYQKGFTQNWTDDPWSQGAFAVFHPGQMTAWGDILGRPEGRVHFAGEHASPWPGWMEGAVWSAERVVQEIL